MNIAVGVMIPFIGTVIGATFVFFVRPRFGSAIYKWLLGLSAGVMLAASIWSLLIPAIEWGNDIQKLNVVPVSMGLVAGAFLLMVIDKWVSVFYMKKKTQTMLFTAILLHNIPEGMVIGILFAGMLTGGINITIAAIIVLSIGIAIQNIPEGAIISIPLRVEGEKSIKAWAMGVFSGVVEPISAIASIFFWSDVKSGFPFILSSAAGAMLYVVVKELIPEALDKDNSNSGYWGFLLGFVLMMILDVALA